MRPWRTIVLAGDNVQVIPGRVYYEGRAMVPTRTSCGVFLLLHESNVLALGPRWAGPGRPWRPRAPAPDTGREPAIALLPTCMLSPAWTSGRTPRRWDARSRAVTTVDWNRVVSADTSAGDAEVLFDSSFEEKALGAWYPEAVSGVRTAAIDPTRRAESLERLSVLYHYVSSRFAIAGELQRML